MDHHAGTKLSRSFVIGLGIVALAGQAGCIPYSGTQFRETAIPALQTGVTSIMNGLIDGIFASIDVEPETSGGSTTG